MAAPLVPTPDSTSVPSGSESVSELLRPFVIVAALVAVMWGEELVDLVPGTPLDSWGIRPRTLRGLAGVVLAPFLHDGFRHLFANSLPFLLMGGAIASSSIGRFVRVAVIVGAVSGLGTWAFGASGSVHLGASGLVFGFLTYLVARGVFARNLLWLAGGVVTLLVYGGVLWGLLPRPGVSWTGHVFGALGGVVAAWLLHRRRDTSEAVPVL